MKFSRPKKLSIVACSIISICLFSASAFAATAVKINDVTAQVQQGTYLCWAAVSSMAAKYLGVTNATQTNIVTAAIGSYYDTTGNVYDMQRGLAAYNVSSTALVTVPTFENVVSNIETNSSVIASMVKPGTNSGHAFLINGYYYNTANSTQNLYYIDPQYGSSNVQNFNTFKSNTNWTWVNTVNNIKRK